MEMKSSLFNWRGCEHMEYDGYSQTWTYSSQGGDCQDYDVNRREGCQKLEDQRTDVYKNLCI